MLDARKKFTGPTRAADPLAAYRLVGYENRDNVGFPNQLVFHTIGQKNTTTPDVTQEVAVLRIRNTGAEDLVINSATVTAGWQVLNAPTAPIAAGGYYDLDVKFTSTSFAEQVQTGTLTIQSNDADEPERQCQQPQHRQHRLGHGPGQ